MAFVDSSVLGGGATRVNGSSAQMSWFNIMGTI